MGVASVSAMSNRLRLAPNPTEHKQHTQEKNHQEHHDPTCDQSHLFRHCPLPPRNDPVSVYPLHTPDVQDTIPGAAAV
jgi:hypothetical protein